MNANGASSAKPDYQVMADQMEAMARLIRMFDPPASDHGWVARMSELDTVVSSMEGLRQHLLWGLVGDLQGRLADDYRENLARFQGYILTPNVMHALTHRFQASVHESLAASFAASATREKEHMTPRAAQFSTVSPDHIPAWAPEASQHPNYDHRREEHYAQEASQGPIQYTQQSAMLNPSPSPSAPSTTTTHAAGAGDANREECGARGECGDRAGMVGIGDGQERVWREWRAWTENAWKIRM
ncbi:hypothetical protein F4680DRAFT_451762 [Xylaria scruposa]|nr:hypothetical protein F4680DRAFT_451762 [Xylaria scruposa]